MSQSALAFLVFTTPFPNAAPMIKQSRNSYLLNGGRAIYV